MNQAEEDSAPYFKMDRSIVRQFNSFEEADSFEENWMERSIEDRLAVIEFLRSQGIGVNNLSGKMDRSYFEIRKAPYK